MAVSVSCDKVLNQLSQWLCLKGNSIRDISKNLASLQNAMGSLKAKRDDVQGRVDREEFNGHRRRLAQVQVWLTNILTIEDQFNGILSDRNQELQRLCICRFCSKNLKLSYRYGKRVVQMLTEVESLISEREFDVVTEAAPVAVVEGIPVQGTIVGQEKMLEKVWNQLMEEEVSIVGLYGMGGVGKTTLLKQINNKFSELSGRFDIVIWVVVSKDATIRKIQEDIGKKLGLLGKEWDEENEEERAIGIYNVLMRKKFVLLLDDIWEKVNLNDIGVPHPTRETRCKVAFTTRSQDVCGKMEVHDPIEVGCLDAKKAWDLFEKKVGGNTLGSHPDIPKLAKQVVAKCRGLPLALNVIGETMASKRTVQEWRRANDVLISYAAEFPGVEVEILAILKYSYDSLNNEKVQSCFLYCSLFPEDYVIEKEGLIEYWIGEGFIDEKDGRERAINQGYEILGTLVRACLLEEEMDEEKIDKSRVKMHDVVREMALWIASDLGKHKERCIVQACVELLEVPKVKDWRVVRRMSLMDNKIKEISESPNCPELTTLLLSRNRELVTISGEFFWSMPMLLVLDLSRNDNLSRLPEQIAELVSLKYLNLSDTKIKRLHVVVQELKMLIHLDLEGMRELESLQGISNLSNLRTLKLLKSNVWLDMSLMKELELLKQLEFLSINIWSSLVMEQLLNYPRVRKCIQLLRIEESWKEESREVLVLPDMDNLSYISIKNHGIREIKIEKTLWNKSLTSPCFSNLSKVRIEGCHGLKDLTWLLFAPNLIKLVVFHLEQIEEIISKEKAENVLENEASITTLPFQKLEFFDLMNLPKLKSIYWDALPFQRLRRLFVDDRCPKLRKLPLDSKSVFKIEEFTIGYTKQEWIERVEWEDEATRLRFLPSLKRWLIYG